jgi:hypothetical protein
MPNEPSYERLPSKESLESDAPLLATSTPLGLSNRNKLRERLHWILHGISCAVILGLLAGVYVATRTSRAGCWDMFNYYCESRRIFGYFVVFY